MDHSSSASAPLQSYAVVVQNSEGVSIFYATLNTTVIPEGCADPLYLNGSTCVTSCPPYYYGNYTSRLCLPLPNGYTNIFNATFYELTFLNTTPVGTILFGFTIYVNPAVVPLGSSILLTITGNIGPSTFASDYFAFLSAHNYVYLHPINSPSDYVVTDQVYYKAQTIIPTFIFNLQSLVPPYQLVGANNVGATIIDICQANPCYNGGTCVYIGNSTATCTCAPGFNGANCSNDINYCTPTTCLNAGTCYDGYGTYTNCTCAPGFNGTSCSIDINYCTPTTCLNGGTCYDGYGTYTNCTCAPGFNGTDCSNDINYCTPTTCLNGGTCYDGYGTYTNCTCAPGFNGTDCSNDINYCTPITCLNGGTCYDGYGTYTNCTCAPGFSGTSCSNDINYCTPTTCLIGGTCVEESCPHLMSTGNQTFDWPQSYVGGVWGPIEIICIPRISGIISRVVNEVEDLLNDAINNPEIATILLQNIDALLETDPDVMYEAQVPTRIINILKFYSNNAIINETAVFEGKSFAIQLENVNISNSCFTGKGFYVKLGSVGMAREGNQTIAISSNDAGNTTASAQVLPSYPNVCGNAGPSIYRLSFYTFLQDTLFRSPEQEQKGFRLGSIIVSVGGSALSLASQLQFSFQLAKEAANASKIEAVQWTSGPYQDGMPLRSSDHGQVMINMSCALLCLYVVFVMSANATPVPALCGTSAALVHYFMLVYFMWTAVEAVFLYIKLGRILGKKKRRFTLKAGLVAWLVPFGVVIISAGAGHRYYINGNYCRANGYPFYLGFILPFLAIYLFNWIVFIVIIVSLVRHAKVAKKSFKQSNVTIAAGLALVLGLGWGFGLAASNNKITYLACALQIVFSVFIGCQGLLILLFHGVRNKDAKMVWRSWLHFVKSAGHGIQTMKSFDVNTEDNSKFTSTLRDVLPTTAQSEATYEPEKSLATENNFNGVPHDDHIPHSTFLATAGKKEVVSKGDALCLGEMKMIENDSAKESTITTC
eukprot:Em0006g43a